MGESRIAESRVRVLRAPVRDGIAMSFSALPYRTMVLVELEDATGVVGRGESWVNFPGWASTERVATLREGVLPLLDGQDTERIIAVQRRLVGALAPLGRQWGAPGPVSQAISAVDVALWDLRGRRQGSAIADLGGGRVRDEVDVYASSLGPTGVAELAARCRDRGFRAVKVKLGFGSETDDANLAAVRRICGDDVEVYGDANQAWSVEEAVAAAPMLREHGVAWIEEPVRGDRVEDLERLFEATGLAIATGENVYGRAAFWSYVESPAVAVVQPDVSKTGGLTEALAVCALAEARGKKVAPHLYGGAVAYLATLQLAALSPAVSVVEYDVRDNPLRDPLLCDPPQPVSGRLALPAGPGLGAEFDGAALDRLMAATP
ncbi:mandelate racemase/muconate lactonizing enzyme family protein [Amycolatopsis endophytica]|uniref:L-alanine-DL-glutamate epimerase-like enolase superfamily enzyme n=1 Tax=Amycolatopsis endophytica TaxID=860233 RepID=A0A853BDD7_9PSEU|nr:mandelate racemase/muconate lactonizing enzyme family protein [Amycolatopsis endophytica]NYI93249.1 L-alanine-DL-glutamate epimerase-like enolase superfamily enzyme [Amycolatopsis endophytica]